MAYFPNGSAGAEYAERYCSACVHEGPEEGPGCPIMLLHLLYNYEQHGKGKTSAKLKSVLDTLIPETKDGLDAEQCSMFLAKTDPEADEAEQRRLAEQPARYFEALAEMRGEPR